jgi:hypothetical protein
MPPKNVLGECLSSTGTFACVVFANCTQPRVAVLIDERRSPRPGSTLIVDAEMEVKMVMTEARTGAGGELT